MDNFITLHFITVLCTLTIIKKFGKLFDHMLVFVSTKMLIITCKYTFLITALNRNV